jgi:hypothetical protein
MRRSHRWPVLRAGGTHGRKGGGDQELRWWLPASVVLADVSGGRAAPAREQWEGGRPGRVRAWTRETGSWEESGDILAFRGRLNELVERATSWPSRATSPLPCIFLAPSQALARLDFYQAYPSRATSRLGSARFHP